MPLTIRNLPTRRIKMKLSVTMLDNEVKSAVINVGKDHGYIEAFIDESYVKPELHVHVYNSHGDVVTRDVIPVSLLTAKRASGGCTTPKFEPAQEHYEGEI
jgi:hypothetical protein